MAAESTADREFVIVRTGNAYRASAPTTLSVTYNRSLLWRTDSASANSA